MRIREGPTEEWKRREASERGGERERGQLEEGGGRKDGQGNVRRKPARTAAQAPRRPGTLCFSPGSSHHTAGLWLRRKAALPLNGEAPFAFARGLAPPPPPGGAQGATRASRLEPLHLEVPKVNQTSPFLHERLIAYQNSLAFYGTARAIRVQIPRGLGDLGDELFRASGSICRNLAEGAACYSRDQKRRYFRIALGSAGECACILDQLEVEQAATASLLATGRSQLRTTTLLTIGLVR